MPVLHLIVGPDGAGKTTLHEQVIGPATGLPFINADRIARRRWPGEEVERSYDAARLAAGLRDEAIREGRSFVAETVFSHPSKLDLIREAQARSYLVDLHVVMIPEELAVARVACRVEAGGHAVPADKIRGRYRRLWELVREAIVLADQTVVYDNTRARRPFRVVARYVEGRLLDPPDWPTWSPLG